MSHEAVRAALEQMEAWLKDPVWVPDPEELARWNEGYLDAVAHAEKGKDWPELMARASVLGKRLDARADQLSQVRDRLKAELDAQEVGTRALKGYKPSMV